MARRVRKMEKLDAIYFVFSTSINAIGTNAVSLPFRCSSLRNVRIGQIVELTRIVE